jgi:hydrogenase expression/formation protein HypE
MRDPTRGGLATTLNEVAGQTGLGIFIDEKNIPVSGKVRTACELLGIDPMYVANEGCAILIVKNGSENKILSLLKKHSLGRNAEVIGEVSKDQRGRVVLSTVLGTQRIVDMLTSEPLPRIC